MLSPLRFLADMHIRGPHLLLWDRSIEFPLERLHKMISYGIWSDAESEVLWNVTYPNTPYQLWISDPISTQAKLKFQDIEMLCPWCGRTGMYDLEKFTLMHTKKVPICQCPSCAHAFNADTLSAQHLKTDLGRFIGEQK
jgi:hypothetical protein